MPDSKTNKIIALKKENEKLKDALRSVVGYLAGTMLEIDFEASRIIKQKTKRKEKEDAVLHNRPGNRKKR